jgi:hypothetical protein
VEKMFFLPGYEPFLNRNKPFPTSEEPLLAVSDPFLIRNSFTPNRPEPFPVENEPSLMRKRKGEPG